MQLDSQIQSMQAQMTQLTGEISSGVVSNPSAVMGNSAALLYQLQQQNDQQTSLQTSAGLAGQRLDTVQDALTSIASTTQSVISAALGASPTTTGVATDSVMSELGVQAQTAMGQILEQLNTSFDGSPVFAGDDTGASPMRNINDPSGPLATVNAVLSAAVSAKGGALSQADVANLLTGPNGLESVFSNTNSNPAQNYNQAFDTAADDGKPTTVAIGGTQTLQYNASANQPAFQDLMQGLSILGMLSAPTSQLDDTAKSALLTQANTMLGQAQTQLTTLQGTLGSSQAALQQVVTTQQQAATATQQQITSYEQADTYADTTKLNMLQTQLQASYSITAQMSQLSLAHYLATVG
jgi:flagellar hook-associated protein 3 FlgL